MEIWQTILLSFGGNAVLLVILGVLGKSLLEKLLARDTLKIEAALKAEYANEFEKLRSELAVAAAERNIRFSKLHERRAEVVDEMYGLLRNLHYRLNDYVRVFEPTGYKSKEERRKDVEEASKLFFDFYLRNKLFLSKVAVKKVEEFDKIHKKYLYQFFYGVERKRKNGIENDEYYEDRAEKWDVIFNRVNEDLTILLDEIENEFRKLLGDGV